jgi:hypothetical protein
MSYDFPTCLRSSGTSEKNRAKQYDHRKKTKCMGKSKGHFSKKGTRETPWGEKVKNLSTTLSEDGYIKVKSRAKAFGLSVSELLERWGRGYGVDVEGSEALPPTLDLTRDWKPQAREILAKASNSVTQAEESLAEASSHLAKAEESFSQVSSDLEGLRQALAHDQQQMVFVVGFLQKLASGNIRMEDLDELTALIDFEDSDLERLTAIVQLFSGGKKTNGV